MYKISNSPLSLYPPGTLFSSANFARIGLRLGYLDLFFSDCCVDTIMWNAHRCFAWLAENEKSTMVQDTKIKLLTWAWKGTSDAPTGIAFLPKATQRMD